MKPYLDEDQTKAVIVFQKASETLVDLVAACVPSGGASDAAAPTACSVIENVRLKLHGQKAVLSDQVGLKISDTLVESARSVLGQGLQDIYDASARAFCTHSLFHAQAPASDTTPRSTSQNSSYNQSLFKAKQAAVSFLEDPGSVINYMDRLNTISIADICRRPVAANSARILYAKLVHDSPLNSTIGKFCKASTTGGQESFLAVKNRCRGPPPSVLLHPPLLKDTGGQESLLAVKHRYWRSRIATGGQESRLPPLKDTIDRGPHQHERQ